MIEIPESFNFLGPKMLRWIRDLYQSTQTTKTSAEAHREIMMTRRRYGYSLDLKKQVKLRMSEEMFDLLQEISKKTQVMNISRLIRRLLEIGLKPYEH